MSIRDWAREGAERERIEREERLARYESEEAEKRERARARFREKFFALLNEWADRMEIDQWDHYWCESTADDGCRATFEVDGVRFIAIYEGHHYSWSDGWSDDDKQRYNPPELCVYLDRMGVGDVPEAAKAFQAIGSLTDLHEALTALDKITGKYGG